MQRRAGGVEADIADEFARGGLGVEARPVRALMHVAAFPEHAQEIGFRLEGVHGSGLHEGRAPLRG